MSLHHIREANLNDALFDLGHSSVWSRPESEVLEFHIQRLDSSEPQASVVPWRAILAHCPVDKSLLGQSPDFLHKNELAKLTQYQMEKRKLEFLSGRIAAKRALQLYLPNLASREIEVKNDIFNRPFLELPFREAPNLSVTHSFGKALALVFPRAHPFGIDIEKVSSSHPDVVGTEMSETEKPLFQGLGLPQEELKYTLNWTIKESYSKAIGVGLTTPFRLLEVEKITQKDGYFESWLKNFHQFRVHSWVMGDYVMSLAVPYKTQLTYTIRKLTKTDLRTAV